MIKITRMWLNENDICEAIAKAYNVPIESVTLDSSGPDPNYGDTSIYAVIPVTEEDD